MESVLQKTGVHRNSRIYSKGSQLLAYADDIVVIGNTNQDITTASRGSMFANRGQGKSILSISRDMQSIGSKTKTSNYIFDVINAFVYFNSEVTSKNDISLKIKQKIIFANTCYYSLSM